MNKRKYIVVAEQKKDPSDCHVREFDSLKNANFYAQNLWDTMSYVAQKKTHVFCGWSGLDDNSDLFSGNIDLDDKCFDSYRMFAIDVYTVRERTCIGHGDNIDGSDYSFDVDMFVYEAAHDIGEISEYVPCVYGYEGEGVVVGILSYIPSGSGTICSEKTFYKIDFQNCKYEVIDFQPQQNISVIKSVISDTLTDSAIRDSTDEDIDMDIEM